MSLARLDDAVCITVADNGIELPENFAGGQGYGMKLLAMVIDRSAAICRSQMKVARGSSAPHSRARLWNAFLYRSQSVRA